jgi:GNAT superfamily N-acetyltransferase
MTPQPAEEQAPTVAEPTPAEQADVLEAASERTEEEQQQEPAAEGAPAPEGAEISRPVLRLSPEDRPRCSELAESRDWGAEERKWELLFEVGEVYGIEDEEHRLIATAVLTRYGTQLAAVSMVLVDEGHERQGHGTAVMRHVIEQAGAATVVLHATPAGRPLYASLGFEPCGTVETHLGRFDPTGTKPGGSQPASEADLLQIARLDHEVHGVHRTAVVKRLPRFAEQIRVLRNEEGLITGYGARWVNGDTTVVGPVIAPDFAGARDLITDLVDGVEGEVRLDVDHEADDLSAWACGHGLKYAAGCTVMALGGKPPTDNERLYAPLMCALG